MAVERMIVELSLPRYWHHWLWESWRGTHWVVIKDNKVLAEVATEAEAIALIPGYEYVPLNRLASGKLESTNQIGGA